jgi:5-methylcytosine-specific restriction endonuclease McrA
VSVHHRRSHHTRDAPSIRKRIEAQLPLPCIEGCGRLVTKDQAWHVAHVVPASQGGRTTLDNCGPAHAGCNLKSGGKLGAATVNRRRRTERQANQGRRQW